MKEFDTIIIGGGLSGSSTALNLSKKGYSVCIIEKEAFGNIKPCAGGMASSMKKFLPLLFERGLPANPGYVIQALQQNNSDLLRGSLTALIRTDPTKKRWAKVEETLTCPLLLQATTDLVQTPQGQFYDGPSLLRWIGEHETDPLTRQRLIVDDLRTREDIVPEIIQLIQQFDE